MVAGVGFVGNVGFAIAQFTLEPYRTIDVCVDRPGLSLDAVWPGSAVAQWSGRVDECLRRLPLVAVHRFDHALRTLASEEPASTATEIQGWAARRAADSSTGWLLDIAGECVETGIAFPRVCRRLGLMSRHMSAGTARAAVTRAVAIGLIAAHEINLCVWSDRVDLDELVACARPAPRQDSAAVSAATLLR